MSRSSTLNTIAVVGCLALSMLAAAGEPGTAAPAGDAPRGEAPARIASGSTVGDRLLFDLCPPDHVVAVAARSLEGPHAHRFAGRTTVRSLDDVEAIVALRPDVFVVDQVGDPRRVERLREAGIEVLQLAPATGLESLLGDIARIGRLCAVPDGGARYANALETRMARIAAGIEERPTAIYLSVYGDRWFGGTTGSSYHDVLTAAGLEDIAAAQHQGWPQYGVEQVLALDPERVVTRAGMRDAICGHDALRTLRACATDGGVVEVEGELLDDPGPSMLDAAEAIFREVHAD